MNFPHPKLARVLPLLIVFAGSQAAAQEKLGDWSGQPGVWGGDAGFGSVVNYLGDVDGDGVPDALIGAPYETLSTGASPGAFYVISGATGAWLQHDLGTGYATLFGYSLCALGDLDGDGVTDYLVGEPDATFQSNGNVYAYSGGSGNLLFQLQGPGTGSFFGSLINNLRDVDMDGVGDFGVGSRSPGDGSVFIYSGATQALLYHFTGPSSGAGEGRSAGVGDIDGDGHADFGISAPYAGPNREGQFGVFSGATRSLIYLLTGENANDAFGADAVQVGDIDLDGHPDLLVSAPVHCIQPHSSEGRVYLYSAATGTLLWSVDGVVYNEQLGQLGTDGDIDFNRDGYPDLAIGSWVRNLVHVYSGRSGTLLYDLRGGPDDKSFGGSLSRMGDLNADGFDDLLVGVPDNSRYYGAAGRAYVFGGNDLFLQANQSTYSAGDTFDLQTTGGEPYALTLTVLTDVNGTGTFIPVAIGSLDANGAFALSATVPNGSIFASLTFMAYAVAPSGHGFVDSIPELVFVQ
jgi:FG-GAP repeat protein